MSQLTPGDAVRDRTTAVADEDPEESPEPPGLRVSARWGDVFTGALFMALGLFTLYAGRDLEFRAEFGAGPGFLPRSLAIILILTGGALAAKQFVKPSQGLMPLPSSRGAGKVAATLGLLIVAVLVIEPLGFILTAILLIAALLFGIERKVTITSGLIALLVPLVFWTLFAVVLGVRLPAGLVSF